MDYIHREMDEIALEGFLFEEQLKMYSRNNSCTKCKLGFKHEFEALREAEARDCWCTDPHFPGEE